MNGSGGGLSPSSSSGAQAFAGSGEVSERARGVSGAEERERGAVECRVELVVLLWCDGGSCHRFSPLNEVSVEGGGGDEVKRSEADKDRGGCEASEAERERLRE